MTDDQRKREMRNGIGMMRYAGEHEKYLKEHLAAGDIPVEELLLWHEKKLSWMQHERLIHWLVTMFTGIIFMVAFGIFLALSFTGVSGLGALCALLISVGILVLLFCYLVHYAHLENTCQHWYMIAEELHEKFISDSGKA